MESEQERKTRQRAARDKQMNDVESSLNRATGLLENSQREIQRSRDLMSDYRAENARQDAAEDKIDCGTVDR
jgi:glycerol kinase